MVGTYNPWLVCLSVFVAIFVSYTALNLAIRVAAASTASARLWHAGGAIAMGHPLGATGAMLLGTLIDELERRDQRYGLATLCVGGGMGVATVVERL